MPQIKYPLFSPTGKGHSFFSFITKYWKAQGKGNNRAFHRLCSLMRKMESESVYIEKIDEKDSDIFEEKASLDAHYNDNVSIDAYKFTFVSKKVSSVKEISGLTDNDFLATANLVNFKTPDNKWNSYLQKSIVCRPSIRNQPLLNNYIHVCKRFNCSINLDENTKKNFNIIGSYFCQQNTVTSVCAHASLCMIINNMEIPALGLISTSWVNKSLGIDHKTIKIDPDKGLSEKEVEKVLNNAGLKAIWHNFFNDPNSDYAEYVYRYIEGRCPALLVFSTNSSTMHVVPVIGHTLNSDIWHAEAELAYHRSVPLHYRSAAEWVDHFIIHDDNFGMYLCLPVASLRKITLPKYDPRFRAYLAIAIVPEDIPTPAREAEYASVFTIRKLLSNLELQGVKLDLWLEHLADIRTPIVVRTLLMKKDDYIQHLESNIDFNGLAFDKKEIEAMAVQLPRRFWLSELTLPDIYTANKSKVIDFIYSCSNNPATTEDDIARNWIQVRFPGVCLFNRDKDKAMPLTVISHFPLFRHEKIPSVYEW